MKFYFTSGSWLWGTADFYIVCNSVSTSCESTAMMKLQELSAEVKEVLNPWWMSSQVQTTEWAQLK